MRRGVRPRRSAAALALAAAGCAGLPPLPDTAVIPTGDGNLMRFETADVAVLDQQGEALARFPNRAGGAPRGAALALDSQLAVVAFERALAVTDLSGANEPTWVELTPPFATRAVSLDGDRCALVDGAGTARVVRLPSGESLMQGPAGVGLGRVALVVATAPAEQVVAGQRGGEVVVQRIDYRKGDGLIAAETVVRDFNVLGAAGHAAGALFLAGIRETSSASTRGAILQYLVIARVDLGTLRVDVLHDEKCRALETRVADLTVGPEMLAVVVDEWQRGTSLRVFDQVQGRRPASWAFERRIEPGSSLAWLSPDYVAVVGGDGRTQVLQVVSER